MKHLRRLTDWIDDDKTQKIFWYVVIAVASAPIVLMISIVSLDDAQLILIGAVLSLVSSVLITRVLHKEEKERRQRTLNKRQKNRLPAIFESLQLLGDSINSMIEISIGLQIGFFIFLVYMFIVFGILLNRFPEL